jgi:diphosphate--fructose-6-phosphate 1-phosphotransferase
LLNKNLKIGIVYCARQSPGGNNIIDGLLDFVKLNGGKLIGFINGTKGLLEGKYMEIKEDNYKWFRNQGGYHMLGRSADKLRFSVD